MKRVVAAALLALTAAACSQKAEPPKAAAPAPPPQKQQQTAMIDPATATLPPGHPPLSAPPAGGTLSGKVLETMDSGGYTYVKLRTGSGDVWAAVQQTKVKVGATTSIVPQMTLDNFESKTLNRKFDHIIFGVAAASGPLRATKAEGTNGRTIAEIWAQKDKLKDAPVAVRGKVVKFLPGIMGKNWLHLRDGSGARDKGDDDITVTTTESAVVGDVVLVSGIVRMDKDFGAGYRYPVMVEEAKVSK
jgi:hypothetical protein